MIVLSICPSNMTSGDPLGAVLMDSKFSDINITGVKFWNNTDFTQVESEIAQILHSKNCDWLVIESNSWVTV